MKGLRWLLVVSVLAVAGCDGGAKSPDFVSERTVTALKITGPSPATTPLASESLPKGTTKDVRALATVTFTVPPGYVPPAGTPAPQPVDGKMQVTLENQDVTTEASWESATPSVATVDGNGRISGVAAGGPVTITASYEGRSDTLPVTVTTASLAGGQVLCVRPATTGTVAPCPASDVYSRPSNLAVPFEAIGRFDDGQIYRISSPPHTLEWASSAPAVAANTAVDSNVFTTAAVGSTEITGEVVAGVTPLPNPADASATLNVTGGANEFCDSEFTASAQIVPELCLLGCSVQNPERITDGDLESFATMNVPLGLLTLFNVSVTVANPEGSPQVPAGSPVGFLLSRTTNDILSAQLLGSLEVNTVRRTGPTSFENISDPATNSEALRLTLLGIRLPDDPQFVLTSGVTSEPYDGVKLTFRGGLLALLASVNVNTVCKQARPPAP